MLSASGLRLRVDQTVGDIKFVLNGALPTECLNPEQRPGSKDQPIAERPGIMYSDQPASNAGAQRVENCSSELVSSKEVGNKMLKRGNSCVKSVPRSSPADVSPRLEPLHKTEKQDVAGIDAHPSCVFAVSGISKEEPYHPNDERHDDQITGMD